MAHHVSLRDPQGASQALRYIRLLKERIAEGDRLVRQTVADHVEADAVMLAGENIDDAAPVVAGRWEAVEQEDGRSAAALVDEDVEAFYVNVPSRFEPAACRL